MPSLSPTMSKGSLLNWSITEGTVVQTGQTIAEIETDKATLDFEVVDDGIVAKLLIPPGTKDIEASTLLPIPSYRPFRSANPSLSSSTIKTTLLNSKIMHLALLRYFKNLSRFRIRHSRAVQLRGSLRRRMELNWIKLSRRDNEESSQKTISSL